MSTPKFADTHNLVAFLEKPKESNGFEEIIDFLNASSVQYALTVNPTIYTSCIEQFWATAKVKTVNGERQLQALVDKKKVIITETSIRSDLNLEDAGGTDCLPTATIFEELARMGRKQRKDIEVSQSSASTEPMTEKETNEESVPKHSYDLSQSGEDRMQLHELMNLYTKLLIGGCIQTGRKIDDLDVDAEEIEFEKVVEELVVSVAATTKSILVSAAEVVTTASTNVEILDELTLAQTLIEIKTAKLKPITTAATTVTSVRPRAKGIIFHDQEEQVSASTKTLSSSQSQLSQVKDKGKGKMVEPEVPLKKKDQVALDEEMARNLEAQLQAELIEEERLARQKEEEANIALIES
ncbi:hypothetical protein Tco_0995915 [Tanacetum coccineum]